MMNKDEIGGNWKQFKGKATGKPKTTIAGSENGVF